MPDALLFVIGACVTAIVGFAVWSIGLLDVDSDDRQIAGARDPGEQDPR